MDPNKDIEVVVVRHPDDGADVGVFVGGQDVTQSRGVRVTVIDPGAGWNLEDWVAARLESTATASHAAAAAITDAYDSYEDSEFVTDEKGYAARA